ncbi:unnamed protein product, partial [Ixodes pacificus]
MTFRVLEDDDHVAYDYTYFFLSTEVTHFGGTLDHTKPRSGNHPYFYEIMCRHERELRQAFPGEDLRGWTVKRLYHSLLELRQQPLLPGEEHKRRHRLSTEAYQGSRVDVVWQLSHAVFPVRTRLFRMGYSRTDRCPECGSLTRPFPIAAGVRQGSYVFYDCLNAAALWRKVAGLYGLPRVTYDTVRFLDPMPVPQRKAPGFGLLVLEVVFQLWTARNKAIYGGNKTALRELVFQTRNTLFARVTEDLATLSQSEFRTRWRNH